MPDLLKFLFGTPEYVSRTDTAAQGPDPDPTDVWAFTDPDAREKYERQNKLNRLERDIRFEVMRGESWQPEELEYKSEIRRLLREGKVTDKGTYWYSSPHSTVYRALRRGSLSIDGKEYRFQAGDELVFQCRMARDKTKEDSGPVLISQFDAAERSVLCGEMSSAMKGME